MVLIWKCKSLEYIWNLDVFIRWDLNPDFLYELTQNNGPMNLSEMGITHLSKWPNNDVGSLRTIYFS